MDTTIFDEFLAQTKSGIRFNYESEKVCRVFTPFTFGDGDHLVIALKNNDENLHLTDEAHLHTRFYYFFEKNEFYNPQKAFLLGYIKNCYQNFNVDNRQGELIKVVDASNKPYALYDFIQCLVTVTNIIELGKITILA